jgi:hypothetical protein
LPEQILGEKRKKKLFSVYLGFSNSLCSPFLGAFAKIFLIRISEPLTDLNEQA